MSDSGPVPSGEVAMAGQVSVAIAEVQPGDVVDVSPQRVEPSWCTVLAVAAGCAEVWADPDAFDGEDRWYCPVEGGCVGVLVFADDDGVWESASPWWHVGAGDAVYARLRAAIDTAEAAVGAANLAATRRAADADEDAAATEAVG